MVLLRKKTKKPSSSIPTYFVSLMFAIYSLLIVLSSFSNFVTKMCNEELRSCANFIGNSKPYIAMIVLQFGYAGMNIITKLSLNGGMSHYVLVVYRHAFATIAIAPFAIIFERKAQPKITFSIFIQIFLLALFGPVIDQNFYYAGLKLTSPTFSCAMSNMLPAMTFVLAVLCRMEKVNMKKLRCQAKVIGTILTVAGAMLMTLYKGPRVELAWTEDTPHSKTNATNTTISSSSKDWLIGSILLIIATLAWASLFVLQAKAIETYKNHQLTLTSLICFVGTLLAFATTLVMEKKASVWTIGWDMNLLASAYAGIVASSIAYYIQGLVIKKRGPVFATSFSPLMMIIVAIMGSFFLEEHIFLGSVIGAVLVVTGLYSVLWGKHKEQVENRVAQEPLPIKNVGGNKETFTKSIDQIVEVKSDQKVESNISLVINY